jgi:hypothetical protein
VPWLGLAILAGLTGRPAQVRDPQVTLSSESKWSVFGQLFAAEGAVLAARDVSKTDGWSPVVRIVELADGKVASDERLELRRSEWFYALDVSAGRVVAKLETKELAFYERRGRWQEVQRLALEGNCRDSYGFLDLADGVLVVPADRANCIYELRDRRWVATAELPKVSGGDIPVTNGDRIVQHAFHPEGLRFSRRVLGGWRIEREIPIPDDRNVTRLAISKRWLAVTYTDRNFDKPEVRVYALGDVVTPFATLRPHAPDPSFGFRLAITDDRLIASGSSHHQVFRFASGTWHPDGTLPFADWKEGTALGDLAWIGRPNDDLQVSGVIDGYRLE